MWIWKKIKVKNHLNSTEDLWKYQSIPIRRTKLVFGLAWTLSGKGDNRKITAICHYAQDLAKIDLRGTYAIKGIAKINLNGNYAQDITRSNLSGNHIHSVA